MGTVEINTIIQGQQTVYIKIEASLDFDNINQWEEFKWEGGQCFTAAGPISTVKFDWVKTESRKIYLRNSTQKIAEL